MESRRVQILRSAALLIVGFTSSLGWANPNVQEEQSWSFSVVPYVWVLGFDGTARIPGLPEISMRSSFGEIWKQLDVGGMIAFEGKKGRFGFVGDVLYSRLSDSGVVPRGIPAEGRVTTFTTLFAAQGEIHRNDNVTVDGIVGLRYWSLDAKASVPGGPSASRTTQWLDPQVGVKATGNLSSRWQWNGCFLLALKDTPSVDLTATLSYPLGANSALHLGYRHLTVRRNGSASGADASFSGPLFGVALRF